MDLQMIFAFFFFFKNTEGFFNSAIFFSIPKTPPTKNRTLILHISVCVCVYVCLYVCELYVIYTQHCKHT